MTTTVTTFGTVERDGTSTTIHATGDVLADWANRSDARWPCSVLATLDAVRVTFDSTGDLVDLEGDSDGLKADELGAWTSECLVRAGYPNHPAIR